MTPAHALLQFSLVAGLLTLTPGMDTALVLRQALGASRTSAMLTALGVGLGCLVWGVAAAVGVSALVTSSPTAFLVIRLAGACYLAYLGVRMLWAALRGGEGLHEGSAAPADGLVALRRGLFTNLLNPKIGVFYVAVLPQFLPPGHSPALVGALLAGVHFTETMAWFAVVTLAAHAVRERLASPRTARVIDTVTGTVLVAFGAHLLLAALG